MGNDTNEVHGILNTNTKTYSNFNLCSGYSLRSRFIRHAVDKDVSDCRQRSFPVKCSRRSFKQHVGKNNSSLVNKSRLKRRKSFESKKKNKNTYFLRHRKEKNCCTLCTNNIKKDSRKISVKLKGQKLKSNLQTKREYDKKKIKGHYNLRENIETRSSITKKSRNYTTKETNIPINVSSNSPKSKEKLRNNKIFNKRDDKSIDDEVLSYKKSPQFKSFRKNSTGKRKVVYNRSYSFERYGFLFPSYEKVLNNINKFREEAIALDAYEEEYGDLDIPLPQPSKNNYNLEKHEEQNLLNCEHLSEDELQKYFHQNLEYIENILKGKSTSKRHKIYENYNPKTYLTMNDLTYSPSIVVFTSNQREVLFKLLEDQFDPNCEKTDYLFKVLLPELCLKIFMDLYEMPVDDALEYLS